MIKIASGKKTFNMYLFGDKDFFYEDFPAILLNLWSIDTSCYHEFAAKQVTDLFLHVKKCFTRKDIQV